MAYAQEVRINHKISTGRTSGRGELALIDQIRRRAGNRSADVRLGIGDDCALLRLKPGEEFAVTTDLSIAGRHFRLDWHPAEAVGHRTLARGLSDLAAMGARPVAAFLSLGLPQELTRAGRTRSWMERFYDGLLALAETYKVPLAGGDLAESPVAVADIVLTGAVPQGKALLRSGASAGDVLYVTGTLGGASAGLARLGGWAGQSKAGRAPRIPKALNAALHPHLYPEPRIAQGRWLMRRGLASAAMDLSDGLSLDLTRLCQESGVSAEVDATALPIFAGATLDQALHGGEDYELLFAAPASARLPRSIEGIPLTRIGRFLRRRTGGPAVTLDGPEGKQALTPGGWEHFS